MSRLGNPAPRGAARFARPLDTDAVTSERHIAAPEPPAKEEAVEAPAPVRRPPAATKQPVTIRLTPAGVERLAELEIALRRSGIRARRASASEIVEALVRSATPGELLELLKPSRQA